MSVEILDLAALALTAVFFALLYYLHKKKHVDFGVRTILAVGLGLIVGLAFKGHHVYVAAVGTVYAHVVSAVVIPLLVFSIISSITNLGNSVRLKNIGLKTVFFLVLNTFFASLITLIAGVVTNVGHGVKYELGYKDCLYITQGTKEVTFASADPEHPAKFYMVSAPAHCSYETRLIKMADANHRPLGSVETCNKRTINQFIHPDVLKTCQLSMGMTALEPGSNWNTMPSHTHERRMEIYTYFELPEGQVVFHMCGEPTQTRHIVMHNEDAVISPSWSIHSGVGTSNYTFIWAMGGENMEFDDMDNIATTDLR